MRSALVGVVFVVLPLPLSAGCDRVVGIGHLPDPVTPPDAPADAPIFDCQAPLSPGDYGARSFVLANVYSPSVSSDETLMYLGTAGTVGSSRYSGVAWTAPVAETTFHVVNSNEDRPSLSYDATHLYFTRRPDAGGVQVPFEAVRASSNDTWNTPSIVAYPTVIGGSDVMFGVATADGQRVVATHGATNRYRIDELVRSAGGW